MLTFEEVSELFSYDPESGLILRKVTTSNQAKKGDVVGSVHSLGYLRVTIKGSRYYNHRIAWLLHYGYWPSGQVDHIDGNKKIIKFQIFD
ncbi:HNH endonuclease signature motif containing protein [Xenorhabdus santafensis]|uniref:HNH endonuclease signature motif containing protein n=1 Tax=Xenorhabdus santafensis TaxID=2582833 RepID=UPI0029E80A0C|nr:HNH endonuclease signature motif containing protein [Xenorhabdus sp. 12]